MTSAQGFARAEASGYHFSETTLTTWTSSKGLSVAHNLQVVGIVTSRSSFAEAAL